MTVKASRGVCRSNILPRMIWLGTPERTSARVRQTKAYLFLRPLANEPALALLVVSLGSLKTCDATLVLVFVSCTVLLFRNDCLSFVP